jgi:hypothetical protein
MKNITVSVSDDTYRQARIWAAKNDTSVSATVQDLLINLPGLMRVAESFTAGLSAAPAPHQRTSSFSGCETVKAALTQAESKR